MRIGVFVCHCGSNIAGTVDCPSVAATALTYPDVVHATDTMYACSEPGQDAIIQAIKDMNLDGVVVASCTPRMHEPTFRKAVERAGLNRVMFEMAGVSEETAREAMRLASHKLPIKTKFVKREAETVTDSETGGE